MLTSGSADILRYILVALVAAGLFLGGPTRVSAEVSVLVRAQVDSVGFATSWTDMEAAVAAACQAEEKSLGATYAELGLSADTVWSATIMPHDDYLYAGRTAVHLLAGLHAKRWIVFGVCHACRRIGVRDRLIFDSFTEWNMAGVDFPVDTNLREQLMAGLTDDLVFVDNKRHAAEHSIEALLPWLRTAVPEVEFVPILVPGMEWPRIIELADAFSSALAAICTAAGWIPGRDIGILISADAVHYGCEGWGSGGYQPFGCDAAAHAAGVAQDLTLAQATLAGPLDDHGPAGFVRLVWNPDHPDYPSYPYRITWCGLYSIPFGLCVASRLQSRLELPTLTGHMMRYGDSVSDGCLSAPGTRLGVTAPNTLQHWVGYPAIGYTFEAH